VARASPKQSLHRLAPERKKIEMLFAHLKRILKLDDAIARPKEQR